jgi:acyl-ACP thioesterase
VSVLPDPVPEPGRVFTRELRPGLADAAPGGRVRLDALARWLQDVAWADVETACSGLGRMWAERTTTVAGDGGAHVEAVALWVHLDPDGGRPMPFTPRELAVYATSAGDRQVKARLRHPSPPGAATQRRPWTFRATELDLAGHVNNAAYWAPLEDELLGGPEPAAVDAEVEFRTPAQPGELLLVADGEHRWIVAPGGEVHASIRVAA